MNKGNNSASSTPLDEQQLQANVDSYRALLKASGIGAWEYSIATGSLNCNDIYFSMLGLPNGAQHHEGKANLKEVWTDLLHPDDAPEAQAQLHAFIQGRTMDDLDIYFRLRHPTKNWIWIWSRGRLLRNNAGEPERAVGTKVDVSAQKEAELKAVKERLLLRTLIDNLPDGIYVKDDLARKVIANIADVRSIGAACEADVIGKTDLELFADQQIGQRGHEDDLSILNTGQPILNKEERFEDSGGQVKWLLTSKIPVRDETGKVIQLLGIGHDITHRKTHDAAIQRLNAELAAQAENLKLLNLQLTAQKEQELEKALAQGKFEIASEVLHDIGNALVGFGSHLTKITKVTGQDMTASVKSLSMFLNGQALKLTEAFGEAKAAALTELAANIAASQERNNAEIGSSVRELINIASHIQEILNIQRQFVRGQEGKHNRKLVDLLRIVEDCRAMMISNYARKGIEFSMNIGPGTYAFNGDPTKIMQVMLNIQKNAAEAISPDAKEKKIRLSLQKTADAIELELSDTGSGFDTTTGEHLFERGFTTKENGTGLGLYNCRSIVESHNGTFDIYSKGPQLGSTVIVRLPAGNLTPASSS